MSGAAQSHKTAIGRATLSRPMRVALASALMDSNAKILDYGCGRGDDLRTLRALGFDCEGWDPAHRPDGNRRSSDLVNLGYVVNVIEHRSERIDTLRSAWSLTQRVLVVAARVDFQEENEQFEDCSDGVLTGRGTFQKFYRQPELRDWIDDTLDVRFSSPGRTSGTRSRINGTMIFWSTSHYNDFESDRGFQRCLSSCAMI